jgi:hypothetical protein
VEILLSGADDSFQLGRRRSLANEVARAEQVKNYLGDFIAALNNAAVLAEFSGGTAVVDFPYRRPFADDDSGLILVDLHLDVVDVEINVERLP